METAMTFMRIAIAGALLASGSALAQTSEPPPLKNPNLVYKCAGADGSVIYSQESCSSDPKKVQLIDTTGALRSGSGGHQDEIAAGVADSDCRDNAYKTTHGGSDRIDESNRHIADYRQRRQALDSTAAYYGGADAETAKAMEDLDSAIAKESEFQQKEAVFSEQNYQNALKACDDARRSASARSAARQAPPPAAPPANNGGG